MDFSKYHLNYCTVKRRGYDEATYKYIFTVHSYPVRMSGLNDVEYLKEVNSRLDHNVVFNDDMFRFEASLVRSQSRILQLGFNNRWDFFVTLTLNENKVDRFDYKTIVKSLLKFFDNYKQRKSSLFRYLVIPEQHKNGAWHFHGFFANVAPDDFKQFVLGDKMSADIAKRVRNGEILFNWLPYAKKFGFCLLDPIRSAERCTAYITKYVTKDMFLKTPEPRTHLYYASRGLKFDEVISVGTASTDISNLKKFECCHNTFCSKYEFKQNVFSRFVEPFTNLLHFPTLLSEDIMQRLKVRALYDFCNSNGLYINDKTDLIKKYERLKDDIIDNKLFEYDFVVQHYAELRAEKSRLKDDLKELFALGAVDDVVDLNYGEFLPRTLPDDVLQNDTVSVESPPQLPEPVIQMNIFDYEDDIPCF